MKSRIQKICSGFGREDGAVTVDWVVLTSALIALGFMASALIWTQTAGASGKVATYIDGQRLSAVFSNEEVANE